MRAALVAGGVVAACLLAAAPAAAEVGFLKQWGREGRGPGEFALPDGVAVDNAGTVWVVDSENNRIERFTAGGRYRPFRPFRFRHWSSAPGRFRMPFGVAVDALGNVFVADTLNHRIQEFTPRGRLVRTWGSKGRGNGRFNQPRGVTVDPFGNVWVADHGNHRVQKFTHDGRFLGRFGAHGGNGSRGWLDEGFNSPRGVGTDQQGNVYVADDASARIVKLDNDGHFITALADWHYQRVVDPLLLPYNAQVDPRGHVWVADTKNNRLVEMGPGGTPDGTYLSKWGRRGGDGSAGHRPGEFDEIYNLGIDCVGNVYATDEENHRVQKFGDPAFGRPVCRPHVFVRRISAGVGRGVRAAVSCDRTCAARLTARVRIPGVRRRLVLRGRLHVLRLGGAATFRVRLPRSTRAAARRAVRGGAHPAVEVVATGRGAPGSERYVHRRAALGP